MNAFWRATLIRSVRTFCQALASMLPVGTVITPVMIQALDWSILYVILAWLGTGLLAGLAAALTAIATGLPEVEYEFDRIMNEDEPEDSEVPDDDE